MHRKSISTIHWIGIVALLLIVFPILYLLLQALGSTEWAINPKLLQEYTLNTLLMALLVGLSSSFIGVALAWIISFYDFPLRKLFRVLLSLPLAIPPYIAAHAYAEFTYFGGLLHKLLRSMGYNQYYDIQNFYGAIFIYIITLYPYVYILCLSFFKHSSASLIDNARVLHAGSWKLFFKVGLPMARLPIVSGATLVIMELVSDFGVVEYFGVPAFSTAIYKTWLNYGDFSGAIRLSALFLLLVFSIVLLESALRRRLRYFSSSKSNVAKLIQSNKKMKGLFYSFIGLVLVFAFLLPLIQLFYNAGLSYKRVLNPKLLEILWTTFYYSSISALVCIVVSFIIANLSNTIKNRFTKFLSRLATMGYSVPGVIIGLAVIFTFIDLDKTLVPLYRAIGIEKKVMVLSTSVFVLVFAYIVRFLAVSYNNLYAGYRKINPNLFKASHTLGYNATQTFFKVDLPLMMPSLLTSFFLVFLEIVKELPITLMLKPYNIETLTGRIHNYVHNEQIPDAAIPSLIIIAFGVIAVTLTMLYKENSHAQTKSN